jgi:hypothetical protein
MARYVSESSLGGGRSVRESSSNCQALAVTDQTPIVHAPFLTEAAAADGYFEQLPPDQTYVDLEIRTQMFTRVRRTGPAQTGFFPVHMYIHINTNAALAILRLRSHRQ